MSKSLNDIEASFSVIATNVNAYYRGNKHTYRPVAVELRKLLCDKNHGVDISLLKRLFPDFHLRPIRGSQDKIDQRTVLYIPSVIYLDGKGFSKVQEFINENAPSLLIDDWLNQKVADASTTMRDFIRSVADGEGAHSDTEYNEILKKTKTVAITKNWALCDQFIIVIARYIIKALAIAMLNKDISKVSIYIREQFAKLGRGGAVLDLLKFTTNVAGGAPLDYKNGANFVSTLKDGPDRQKVISLIDSYQPRDTFLLLIKDINSEFWLYEQRINV